MFPYMMVMPNMMQNSTPPGFDLETLERWRKFCGELQKEAEEKAKKKDDPKDKKWKPTTVEMAIIMLLFSPITGPLMFTMWKVSLNMMKAAL